MTDIAIGAAFPAGYTLAHRAEYDAIEAQRRATMEAADKQHEAITKGTPSLFRSAPNVINLTREQSLEQIQHMSELIQSGDAEGLPLFAAKGNQTTSNYRQYVYWLQQHVKELEGAQSSMDVKV